MPRPPPGRTHALSEDLIAAVFAARRPARRRDACVRPRRARDTAAVRALIAEMCAQGIVRPCGSELPTTGTLTVRPKGPRLVPICDLRAANARFGRPPRMPLPSRACIARIIRTVRGRAARAQAAVPFFAHIDVTRCFDSFVLPPSLTSAFVFAGPDGTHYAYNRLPFGWSFAPHVVQRIMTQLVTAALPRGVGAVVYIDDIVLVAPTARAAARAVSAVIRALRVAGLQVSAKSQLVPAPRMQALGCVWQGRAPYCRPVVGRTQMGLMHALLRRCVFDAGQLRRFAGAVQWWAPHALPFLSPLFAELCRAPRRAMPRPHLRPALTAALRVVFRVASCGLDNTATWQPVTAPRSRPVCVPYDAAVFCDAAADCARAGYATFGAYSSRNLPRWLMRTARTRAQAQQLAELFALVVATKRAIRFSHRVGRRVLVVSDSSSALLSVLRLPAHVYSPHRALLLRRVVLARLSFPQHNVRFAYVESKHNIADAPSRGLRPVAARGHRVPVCTVPSLRRQPALMHVGRVLRRVRIVRFAPP